MHPIVFGERGVGKTSLAAVAGEVASHANQDLRVVRQNCEADETFDGLFRRCFSHMPVVHVNKGVGFQRQVEASFVTMDQVLDPHKKLTPGLVVEILRSARCPIAIILDEFDRVQDRNVTRAVADTMKALSDHAIGTKVIIVGVADSVTDLIESHVSIERCCSQIHVPSMDPEELDGIITRACEILALSFTKEARDILCGLALGFPHFVHLVGQRAAKQAIEVDKDLVDDEILGRGIGESVRHMQASLVDAYSKAVASPRKESLGRHVLCACALAEVDPQGYFRPSGVKEVLEILLDQAVHFATFSGHLASFVSADRGAILKKTGTTRNYRYRFANPMPPPMVLCQAYTDGILTREILHKHERGMLDSALPEP